LLISREEFRLTTFNLDGREHLRHVQIAKQDLSAYGDLLGPEVAHEHRELDRVAGHHLKKLKLPTMWREHEKVAAICRTERADFPSTFQNGRA